MSLFRVVRFALPLAAAWAAAVAGCGDEEKPAPRARKPEDAGSGDAALPPEEEPACEGELCALPDDTVPVGDDLAPPDDGAVDDTDGPAEDDDETPETGDGVTPTPQSYDLALLAEFGENNQTQKLFYKGTCTFNQLTDTSPLLNLLGGNCRAATFQTQSAASPTPLAYPGTDPLWTLQEAAATATPLSQLDTTPGGVSQVRLAAGLSFFRSAEDAFALPNAFLSFTRAVDEAGIDKGYWNGTACQDEATCFDLEGGQPTETGETLRLGIRLQPATATPQEATDGGEPADGETIDEDAATGTAQDDAGTGDDEEIQP